MHPGGRNFDKFGVLLQLADVARAAITQPGAQAANHLRQHLRHMAAIRNHRLHALGHDFGPVFGILGAFIGGAFGVAASPGSVAIIPTAGSWRSSIRCWATA